MASGSTTMIDWLKRAPRDEPSIVLAGRAVPIVIRRLAHAKRMTLRLAPDGSEVRISVPRWARTAEALAFAHARTAWLAEQSARTPVSEPPRAGGTIRYRGAAIAIDHAADAPRAPTLADGVIRLGGPPDAVSARLRRWLERQALSLLTEDLTHYCAAAGRPAPRLALANARRRWGSCAADGSIRINWRLIMAPDHVRRSVVAHEAAHLVHFDHSPRFHALLAEIFEGDIAAANAWLKREGQSLYQPFG
jgi:predicted metal-dependent hydrolase